MAIAFAVLLARSDKAPAFGVGLTDSYSYESANEASRLAAFNRTVDARAGLVLLTANWLGIAPSDLPASFNPADPADPAYQWDVLDSAVRAATEKGLGVAILVAGAPPWAEGPNRPSLATAPAGSWRPDPGKLRQFAIAIATRYSGSFTDPAAPGLGPLPRVMDWQLWGEPNLSVYLTPQWNGHRPVAPIQYRAMLNAFYAGIKSVNPGDKVITGGTAPYGDSPGGARMQPALFWRTLLCLKGQRLRPTGCPDPAHFDIAAHNPIDEFRPTRGALNRDDISTPDLGRLKRILAKARSTGRSKPGGRKQLWATEIWWESNPPDPSGVPAGTQARWLEQSFYLLWKQGVQRVVWFEIVDTPPQFVPYQTGLFLSDGTPKPAYSAYRFPFVADRLGKQTVRVWGMAPTPGGVQVQRKRGAGWHTVKRLSAGRDRVFVGKLGLRGAARLRARADGETSLTWRQG